MNTCNVVVNQHQDKVIEVKKKHPGRIAQGHKMAELMRLRKLGLVPQKTKPITLKEMLQDFKKDLHDPTAVLIAIDETIKILEENKLEIKISLKKI